MYLSTTDYVQHKAAPGSEMANSFYAMMDRYVGELDAAGCVLVLTADHGMNDKHLENGEPDVIYLQNAARRVARQGCRARASCRSPILTWCITARWVPTRPFICRRGPTCDALLGRLRAVEGVDVAMSAAEACERFELPPDRFGDVVVISTIHKVLGTAREKHDLSGLTEPLRSHGGLTEQVVPMIANRAVTVPAGSSVAQFRYFRCGAEQGGGVRTHSTVIPEAAERLSGTHFSPCAVAAWIPALASLGPDDKRSEMTL